MRISTFAGRNQKELLRDPLSYIFCLGFPIVMLVIMTAINTAIPPEAGMTAFQIQNLSGGIVIFGLTFVMLFTCLGVAKDRTSAFLTRLYASPMKSWDFILGYMLPLMIVAIGQSVITFIASAVIGIFTDYTFSICHVLLALLALLPADIMFIGIGLLFGNLFGEKAAPGMCSIIISIASVLGGVWMDLENMGGTWLKICQALPFYPATKTVRCAISGDFSQMLTPLLVVSGYAVVIFVLAVLVFRLKMKKDLK